MSRGITQAKEFNETSLAELEGLRIHYEMSGMQDSPAYKVLEQEIKLAKMDMLLEIKR